MGPLEFSLYLIIPGTRARHSSRKKRDLLESDCDESCETLSDYEPNYTAEEEERFAVDGIDLYFEGALDLNIVADLQ